MRHDLNSRTPVDRAITPQSGSQQLLAPNNSGIVVKLRSTAWMEVPAGGAARGWLKRRGCILELLCVALCRNAHEVPVGAEAKLVRADTREADGERWNIHLQL